jgi:hypothetical protein
LDEGIVELEEPLKIKLESSGLQRKMDEKF